MGVELLTIGSETRRSVKAIRFVVEGPIHPQPIFRQIVSVLSPHTPELIPTPIHVGFVVDSGTSFPQSTLAFRGHCHPIIVTYAFFFHRTKLFLQFIVLLNENDVSTTKSNVY
jgi:hypothetical protein